MSIESGENGGGGSNKKENKIEIAPEGWDPVAAVARIVNADDSTLKKAAEKYRASHSEWFKFFLHPKFHRVTELYSPELIHQLRKDFESKGTHAPEGWRTTSSLSKQFQGTYESILKIIDRYRTSHPKWFSIYLNPINRPAEHLHPELVQIIIEKMSKREKAPYGWTRVSELSKTLGVTYLSVKKKSDQHKSEHPEWFTEYLDEGNKLREYIHPDLALHLREEFVLGRSVPPIGWLTRNQIVKDTQVTANAISKAAEPFRETRPEWFESYMDKSKRVTEHYDPRLVQAIRETLSKREHAPPGWLTSLALANELDRDFSTVRNRSEAYKQTHPDWFKTYLTSTNHPREYLHPELVRIISEEIQSLKQSPPGWMTAGGYSRTYKIPESRVLSIVGAYRDEHPEWFKAFLTTTGKRGEHYHPELIKKLTIDAKQNESPRDWATRIELAQQLGVHPSVIQRIAERYREDHPEWFDEVRTSKGLQDFLHPEMVAIITDAVLGRQNPPEGWLSITDLSKEIGLSYGPLKKMADRYRGEHPEWFNKYTVGKKKQLAEYYHPDLIKLLVNEYGKGSEGVPLNWDTTSQVSKKLGVEYGTIQRLAEPFRVTHPEWFRTILSRWNAPAGYLHPDLISVIQKQLESRAQAPEGWRTRGNLAREFHAADTTILKIVESYRPTHPEWFALYQDKQKKIVEHFHPALIDIVIKNVESRPEFVPSEWITLTALAKDLRLTNSTVGGALEVFRETHPNWFKIYRDRGLASEYLHPELSQEIRRQLGNRERNQDKERELAESKLKQFLETAQKAETAIGQHFRSLLKAFGSSRYLDVLYKFRPEFKGIPAEKVKGLMAEYLGDFLISRGGFDKGDIEAALEHLSDLSLQEGLYEMVKDDCFQFFLKQRRADGTKDPALVLKRYHEHVQKELGHLDHPLFREIVDRTIAYYSELYSKFEKPTQIVDSLEENRDFPDLNQLINIREIAEKKRMLIADEMGLGKSASVILSKESLGVNCALTVVPSNVIETWKRYLSDKPEQGGYFKSGQGPRVFVVEKSEQLQNLSWEQYDYILISQEKLQGAYPEQLKRIGYDMLIVDEAHKLKTPAGTRSSNLIELTNEAGEHGYLALLSGTPVPNKIEDIAVTLKLLYPEKFKDISSKQLVHSIIKGDLVDLRSLLLPKMQRKRLEDGVEMPPLEEHEYKVELSKLEQQIYEVLLEDDELVATEKMRILRQFLLNPALVDSTPGIEGAKIIALRERLADAFKESSNVVVFVNDYVEGVLRGPDSISNQLGLPPDVRIVTIHGATPRSERDSIQRDLREGAGRTLLFVSGQTADVGVDFSAASHVVFYNEPWTEYQKRQELARVYRPGLKHALESETLIAEGTIEQGMHEYIRRKHSAIEKLLSGVPITELEQRLLERAEKEDAPDLSVNPELAKYYFSSWDKMLKIFGYVKELGEEQFELFLKEHGSEYAEGYQELGNRSYQANANRFASTLIDRLVRESKQEASKQRILDMASGPEMLRKHGSKEYRDSIVSLDLNPAHFKTAEGKFVAGSWLKMPFPDKSFDYLNLSLSLHYTNFIPKKGKLERLELLKEMNRVLEVGGKAVLSLIYSYGLKNPELLREAVKELGFEVAEAWTGEASQSDSFKTYIITLNKLKDLDPADTSDVLSERLGREKREGLKFAERKVRLRDSRRILTGVQLNGEALPVQLNEADQEAYTEEQQVLRQGERLRDQYGSIAKIPAEKIIELGFARIRSGEKYILFKKLEKGSGAILVR